MEAMGGGGGAGGGPWTTFGHNLRPSVFFKSKVVKSGIINPHARERQTFHPRAQLTQLKLDHISYSLFLIPYSLFLDMDLDAYYS